MKFLGSCCGCCDLRTGTLVVGIFSAISAIGGIITDSALLERTENEESRTEIKVGIGYCYLYIAINALLIYGAIKRSKYFLLPWLVFAGIGFGLLLLASVILLFFLFVPVYILIFVIAVLLLYPWFCVLSYYNQLAATNPPPINVYYDTEQNPTVPTTVKYVLPPPMYTECEKKVPQAL